MSKRTKIVVAAAVVLIAAVGGGVWWYLRDDAPEEVSLSSATEAVTGGDGSTTTAVASGDGGSDASDGTSDDLSGTWTVDTSAGDVDEGTGSFAGFRIEEELSTIGSTTAVGRTGDVSGSVTIDGTTVTDVDIEVDVTTIATDDSRRDGKVQDALETDQFPTATFSLTEPIELPEGAAAGEPVEVNAVGELTIHGVTQQVELPIEAQLVDGSVVLVGSLELTFSDYGVEVPSSPIVLSVEDTGTLEIQLVLVRES